MAHDLADSERRVAWLEKEIAAELERYVPGAVREVRLAPWAVESDLSANVDLEVSTAAEAGQEFSVVTLEMLTRLFAGSPDKRDYDVYTSGDRLIVVRDMSPDAIARGILSYLGLRAL
jgi:hypothetical protein